MAFALNVAQKFTKDVRNGSAPKQRVTAKVVVDKIIFKDHAAGFYIIATSVRSGAPNIIGEIDGEPINLRKITITGTSASVVENMVEGQEINVIGTLEKSKRNGAPQLEVSSVEELLPTSPRAMKLFLSSGKIKGIGPVTAEKIVKEFGVEAINILNTDPQKYLIIPGMSVERVESASKSWNVWKDKYEVLSLARFYEIGDVAALKIFDYFKEKSVEIIKTKPYELTKISGVGFKTADKIAKAMGVPETAKERLMSGALFAISELLETGNTLFKKQIVIDRAVELLDVTPNKVVEAINELLKNGQLIETSGYLDSKGIGKSSSGEELVVGFSDRRVHALEKNLARSIISLAKTNMGFTATKNSDSIKNMLIKSKTSTLDESQMAAAISILQEKVSILTGGPGTGKTHTIKSLLDYFDRVGGRKVNCVLAAPTGMAAKRMSKATGRVSTTIHTLLKWRGEKFEHNEENKLSGDIFILDESSMIDLWLFASFVKALPHHARLILVGDVNQLEPVGAGKVFKDLINSKLVNTARLKTPHRQALESDIIVAAHEIIQHKMPKLNPKGSNSDFVFVEAQDQEEVRDKIFNEVKELLNSGVSPSDIQVLSPKREGDIGVNGLNHHLRGLFNPAAKNVQGGKFIVGDKVVQNKNNKELGIFNGDIGIVEKAEEGGSLLVRFGEKLVEIDAPIVSQLSLAYALTIHKSQGSDYPYVVMPISKSHTFMLDANLLYTAVTRGKTKVTIVGDKRAMSSCVAAHKQKERLTGFRHQIEEESKTSKFDADPFAELRKKLKPT